MELVYCKNICFEVIQNGWKLNRLEQRSVIKFLLAEKCKPCEIYRRLYNEYGEACLVKKMFTNALNMILSIQAWVKQTVHGVEIHWLSSKEKVLCPAVSLEGHAKSLPGHERIYHYWLPWKRCNYKQCFLLPTS